MIKEHRDISNHITEVADVCIIGTGAGGAVVAKELAEKGLNVVALEEGSHFTLRNFNQVLEGTTILARPARPARHPAPARTPPMNPGSSTAWEWLNRNSKPEIRSPKEIRNPNPEFATPPS